MGTKKAPRRTVRQVIAEGNAIIEAKDAEIVSLKSKLANSADPMELSKLNKKLSESSSELDSLIKNVDALESLLSKQKETIGYYNKAVNVLMITLLVSISLVIYFYFN